MTLTVRPRTDDIPGWFHWLDRRLFRTILTAQADLPPGDLVELGCYLGKSAVVVGEYLRPGEQFYVVDLFGDESLLEETPEGRANRREAAYSYNSLDRAGFEANYLRFHGALPQVIQGLSSDIVGYVAAGGARFIHVDASHLYEQVREDTINAARLLAPGGAVVFDDYRAEHTPGVAAAVWQAVVTEGLIPFALTSRKLYGCYDDPEHYLNVVAAFAGEQADVKVSEEHVAGHRILRLRPKPGPVKPAGDTSRELADAVARRVVDSLTPELTSIRSRLGKLARRPAPPAPAPPTTLLHDLAPPLVLRWWRARKR